MLMFFPSIVFGLFCPVRGTARGGSPFRGGIKQSSCQDFSCERGKPTEQLLASERCRRSENPRARSEGSGATPLGLLPVPGAREEAGLALFCEAGSEAPASLRLRAEHDPGPRAGGSLAHKL
ncbi:unnamed protein product [Rangifer tarandus platyrhynchus]|uniref:Secreted protein n=1 Tax=Rangifer tarandus platyrhynchus TaxID=3082113 RepID=A0ABN8ZWF6_RANTA|nr:unnamed protein product [Rangifer tarandus platyrhynchus]